MTVLTLRRIRDHFVVTGPDIEPVTFKTRAEARDWCLKHTRARQFASLAAVRGAHRRQRWLRLNWLKFWSAAPT
jgi:hypothetical protein